MTISERLGAIGSVLDARVACQSAAAPGAKPLGRCWPALAVSGLVLAVLVYMNTLLGLNEEMTGTVYLHPYQLLALDASTPRWSECADGFFVQTIKPVFGVCIQGQPLPLLSKSYIPVWSYWPLWWIGSHIPHYVPILVNVIPALIAATLLCLMAVQVCRHDGPLLASLSVAGILLFPFAVLYGSLYLFESLPVTALLGVWWLLDRYNDTGRTRALCLAALLAGFACHQKFTTVLVLVPFLAAYAAVFGCRRLSFRKATAAAVAGCVFPALALAILSAYAAARGAIPDTGAQPVPAPWSYVLFAAPSWVFAALPSPGFSAAAAARMTMLVALLVQCGRKVFLHFRRAPQPRVEVLAALTLPGTLCGFAVVYRYNTGSLPSFPLLPFVAIVIGSLWCDAGRWLAPRLGHRAARHLLVGGFSAFTLAAMAIRWPSTFEDAVTKMGYPRFSDQSYATAWLLEHKVREPVIPTFSEIGVLEFLSEGRIRPRYVGERDCSRLERAEWEKALAATRHRHTDFLVPTPYFAKQQVARHCDVGAEDLAAALRASGRSVRETKLSTPSHTWDFTLFSVAASEEAAGR